MPRKTAKLTVFYLLGLAAASFIGSYIGVYIGAAFFVIGAVSAIYSKKLYSVKLFSAAFGVGLVVFSAFFGIKYDSAASFDGAYAEISGNVTAVREISSGRAVYTVDGLIGGTTRANVTAFISEQYNKAEVGDSVTIRGKLQILKNTYTFATADYNRSKGIFLQFKTVDDVTVIHKTGSPVRRFAEAVKSRIYTVISRRMSGEDGAVFKAMLFGDRSGISDTLNMTFSRAGVSHIMAVSGAQLSIICSYAAVMLGLLRVGRFRRFFVCVLLIAFFLLICEDSISIARAAIMIIITFAVPLINRQSDTATSLALSCFLLTAVNPFLIRDASFLMSAGGVLAVAVISPPVIEKMRKDFKGLAGKAYMGTRDIFISSGIVSLTLFPITFLFFDEVSILSPATNILLIPISTLVIILGMLTVLTGGFAPIAALLFPLIGLLCRLTVIISQFAAGLPFAFIPTGYDFERPLIFIFIAAALIIALLIPAQSKLKNATFAVLGSFAVFIIVVSIYRVIPDDKVYAAVLGDERGAAIVVHDKFSAVVFDINGNGEAAPAVAKYLSGIGIGEIAAVAADSGAIWSIPTYMKNLPSEYFPVRLYAAPIGLNLPASVIFPKGEGVFYEDNGGFIEYEYLSAEFYESGTFITLGEDFTVFVCESGFPPGIETAPDAIIYTEGRYAEKIGNERIIAVLDSAAAVSADTATAVYIGQSIRISNKGDIKIIY
ncbi:MAG: ComEC family competence protein [Ruminococcus sp.]|jgi:ComEC/Rec2-related protein|nr:ComEC family competence protein [Ruminococcus sp.]